MMIDKGWLVDSAYKPHIQINTDFNSNSNNQKTRKMTAGLPVIVVFNFVLLGKKANVSKYKNVSLVTCLILCSNFMQKKNKKI